MGVDLSIYIHPYAQINHTTGAATSYGQQMTRRRCCQSGPWPLVVALIVYIFAATMTTTTEAQECTQVGNEMMCLFNQVTTGSGYSYNWTFPYGVDNITVTLWGGGGGGSATTFMESQITQVPDEVNQGIGAGWTSGGGSGSAIVNYTIQRETEPQFSFISIGGGGSGGVCGGSITGSTGGDTKISTGTYSLVAYGGGGGGSSSSSSSDFGYGFGGGGGGSAGDATSSGQGGSACTSTCPAGEGPAGGSSPEQTLGDSGTCSPPSGTTLGYWISGGAGAFCNAVTSTSGSSYYNPVPCSTQDWGGPCGAGSQGCNGASSKLTSYQYSNLLSSPAEVITFTYCIGAGAPGYYGSTSDIPNSGAGGGGCPSPVTLSSSNSLECNGCVGETGGAGGVIITYTLPSRTFPSLS